MGSRGQGRLNLASPPSPPTSVVIYAHPGLGMRVAPQEVVAKRLACCSTGQEKPKQQVISLGSTVTSRFPSLTAVPLYTEGTEAQRVKGPSLGPWQNRGWNGQLDLTSWLESRYWEPTGNGHGVEGKRVELRLVLEGYLSRVQWTSGL